MKDQKSRFNNAIIVDGHCDTLLEIYKHRRSFWENNSEGHLDWPRLLKGCVGLQFMAIYIEPEYKPYGALCRALELIDFYNTHIQQSKNRIHTLYEKNDLKLLGNGTISLLLTIEGGEALEGKLSTLRMLYQLGIRSITLTWNQRNRIADGVWEENSRGGLTHFGKEVVREMNKLGMLIDTSHLSESGFWEVLSNTIKPIAATHSCCRALHDHPRNLKDSQLKALGDNNGIIGINFYPGFLGNQEKITIEHVLSHIEHAVEFAGIDHVGLGSDFDGIDKVPSGLEDASKIPGLLELMYKRGWKEKEILKIAGGNFIRVLSEVLNK